MQDLADRLWRARQKVGVSRVELAAILNVSVPALATWESGSAMPREQNLSKLRNWIEEAEGGIGTVNGAGSIDSPDEEKSGFGDWLRNERESRGLSRAELASRANLTQQAIYLIETGRVRNPWKATREQLVAGLGSVDPPPEVLAEVEEESEIQGLGEFNDFSPWEDSMIPQEACVYVYYDRTDRPVYIGQTHNLRRRNRQHQESGWYMRPLIARGAYIQIDDPTQRTQLEKVLIQFLGRNVLLNKQSLWKQPGASED